MSFFVRGTVFLTCLLTFGFCTRSQGEIVEAHRERAESRMAAICDAAKKFARYPVRGQSSQVTPLIHTMQGRVPPNTIILHPEDCADLKNPGDLDFRLQKSELLKLVRHMLDGQTLFDSNGRPENRETVGNYFRKIAYLRYVIVIEKMALTKPVVTGPKTFISGRASIRAHITDLNRKDRVRIFPLTVMNNDTELVSLNGNEVRSLTKALGSDLLASLRKKLQQEKLDVVYTPENDPGENIGKP